MYLSLKEFYLVLFIYMDWILFNDHSFYNFYDFKNLKSNVQSIFFSLHTYILLFEPIINAAFEKKMVY